MRPAVLFAASCVLAAAGTLIALGALAAIQQSCHDTGDAGTQSAAPVDCTRFLSYYWVVLALQLFFLASTGAAVVAGAVHTFRTTLHTQAAVCISVGIVNCWQAYAFFLKGGAQGGTIHDRWVVLLVGMALYVSADVLMSFSADAMCRLLRVERRNGFVTFRRLPPGWLEKQEHQKDEGEAEGTASSAAGPLLWAFLASAALAVAGTFVALGGTASLQSYCDSSSVFKTRFPVKDCDAQLSLFWVVWAVQCAFLVVTGLAYARKQIHTYKASLWSTAAVAAACASQACYYANDYQGANTGTLHARYMATLIGFALYCGADLLLILVGDAMYRLKHLEGADGFVSMRRPGSNASPGPAAAESLRPKRPIEWAFLLSVGIAAAGTFIALGGMASAQAECEAGGPNPGYSALCDIWLSYPWFAWALQLCVLAATVAAWMARYVHSFKSSVWAMAAVVIYASLTPMNRAYLSLDFTSGALHTAWLVMLIGFAVFTGGNYLILITGDALHHVRRVEGADGFITFRRPNVALPAVEASPEGDKV